MRFSLDSHLLPMTSENAFSLAIGASENAFSLASQRFKLLLPESWFENDLEGGKTGIQIFAHSALQLAQILYGTTIKYFWLQSLRQIVPTT